MHTITNDTPTNERIQLVIETYAQHVENNTGPKYDARTEVINDDSSEWLDEIIDLAREMGWAIDETDSEDGTMLGAAADLWRSTLTVPRTGIIEACCTRCGETFNPGDPFDFEHIAQNDGTECRGAGRLTGYAA